MSRGDLTLIDQLLEKVTDGMVEEALGYREDPSPAGARQQRPGVHSASRQSTRMHLEDRHTILIVRFETGGKAYYERVVKGRPVWPGFQSGITIGCGYDLGYHKLADFQARMGQPARQGGFRSGWPRRSASGRRSRTARKRCIQAKALVQSLSDIVVPWDVAIEQFDKAKFPAYIQELYRALDNLDRLHPHCQGALLSLVFNRGAQFATAGERYAEMRAIGELMKKARPRRSGKFRRNCAA